jgi:hypothetical protein
MIVSQADDAVKLESARRHAPNKISVFFIRLSPIHHADPNASAGHGDNEMNSDIHVRRGKVYLCGYEGDTVSALEIAEFEKAWTCSLGVGDFTAVSFPGEDSIDLRPCIYLRPCRVKLSTSRQSVCTTDKYSRLYHAYGSSSVDVTIRCAANSRIPPMRTFIHAPKTISSSYSAALWRSGYREYGHDHYHCQR